MKIALFLSVLTGLLSLIQARLQATVREQAEEMAAKLGGKKKQLGWHAPIRVSFKMEHFKSFQEPDEFNKKVAAGAFNRAFEQVFEGMSTDWGFIDSLVEVPEDPTFLGRVNYHKNKKNQSKNNNHKPSNNNNNSNPGIKNTWTIPYGTYTTDAWCRLCPPDLLSSGKNGESFSNFLKDQAKWDEAAKLFCAELKGTGIENFEDIKNCAFTVSYLGANELEMMESSVSTEVMSSLEVSGSTKSIITAFNIRSSASFNMDVLEKSFAVAYNNVFEDYGYVVEGVQLLRQVIASQNAESSTAVLVHDNNIALSADRGALVTTRFWVNIDWKCQNCNARDLLPGVLLQNMPEIGRHNILESYLCNNLRDFGDASLADVTGCGIVFPEGM
ncbi:hypothetical protein FisN_32Hh018 [Fistulifera solaris]|uniref:Uncharacterized protein n=1 Tax=Fistulifera solaris TaxID=1519565 RepID=A0A1Z5K370_FISSO|nr:hypothetical protein FisN_32Hh018 [Fistulifera solaris]|eukprot:GAX20636.1 hypothetical protein FisN_32Hh018 [Fistulifera solaris]